MYTTNYTYDNESKPILLTYGNVQRVEYTYDALGRIQKRKVGAEGSEVETNLTYMPKLSVITIPLIHTILQNGFTLAYTYDDNGNTLIVSDGTKATSRVLYDDTCSKR